MVIFNEVLNIAEDFSIPYFYCTILYYLKWHWCWSTFGTFYFMPKCLDEKYVKRPLFNGREGSFRSLAFVHIFQIISIYHLWIKFDSVNLSCTQLGWWVGVQEVELIMRETFCTFICVRSKENSMHLILRMQAYVFEEGRTKVLLSVCIVQIRIPCDMMN